MHESIRAIPQAQPPSPPGWRAWLPPVTWPSWLRRLISVLLTITVALAGAWIALVVAGTSHAFVGPLAIDVAFRPTLTGESVIHLDPVGAVVLKTHQAPVTLDVSVRQVDLPGLSGIVAHPQSLTRLDDQITSGIEDVLVKAAIRAAITVVLGGALAAALVLRSIRRTLLAAGVLVLTAVGTYGLAALTYSPDSVREPTYSGPLAAAPKLIGNAEEIANNFDAYAEQLAGFVTNVAAVYNTTLKLDTFQPNDDTIRVLHVSDLHLNPAAWDIIDAVADQYDVDIIVDSGDIVDQGTSLESSYVHSIGDLGRPYVYVKGNHDSIATVAAIAVQPNAIILDGEPVEVKGVRFFGAPDPRFTPDKSVRGVFDEQIKAGSEEFAAAAHALEPQADVLVFHDPKYVELLDGAAPLVLSGHLHKRDTFTLDQGTRVMIQGSTGAAGLRGLQNEEPTPAMLSVLFLDRETKQLVAWDDLTLGGLGQTSVQIDRHQAKGDDHPTKESGPASLTVSLEN